MVKFLDQLILKIDLDYYLFYTYMNTRAPARRDKGAIVSLPPWDFLVILLMDLLVIVTII